MVRRLGILVVGMLGVADAQEVPLVARIRQAVRAKDEKALADLVGRARRSLWEITETLVSIEDREAASRVAAIAPIPDAAALRRYAADGPRASSEDSKRLRRARNAGSTPRALEALADFQAPATSVTGILGAALRGTAFSALGRFEDAARVLDGAAESATAIGWLGGETLARKRLILPLHYLQHYLDLLENGERLVALHEALGEGTGPSRADLGAVYLVLGSPDQARPHLEAALAMATDAAARANILVLTAQARAMRGGFAEALRLLGEAADLAAKSGDALAVADVAMELGNVHGLLGDDRAALRAYGTARARLAGTDAHDLVASVLGNIARVRARLGEDAPARALFEKARIAFLGIGDVRSAARTELGLGDVHRRHGRTAEAARYYKAALARLPPDSVLAGYALCLLGDIEKDGAPRYERAATIARKREDLALRLDVEERMCVLRRRQGKPAEALAHARAGLALFETMTGGLADGEQIEARADTDRRGLFAAAVAAAVATGSAETAWTMLERTRGAAFRRAVGSRAAMLGARAPAELAAAEETARSRLAAARAQLRAARDAGALGAITDARAAVAEAEARHAEVERALQRAAKGGAADVAVASLASVRAGLAPGEVLVLYAPDHAVVVSADAARLVARRSPPSGFTPPRRADPEFDLDGLRAALLAPLELPGDVRRIVVVPDGRLATLPWPVLVRDGVEVVLAASGSAYARATPAPDGKRILALGDPDYGDALPALPATRAEVTAVATDKDVTLLGSDASESKLRAALADGKRWRAVHLACHGLLDRQRPEFCALALASDDTHDGHLTALEILRMPCDADLVALSACETGGGRAVAGEGLVGLARAFRIAGARQVLVSLWRVDDEATRVLMARFHLLWRPGGTSAAAALRQAQKHVAGRPEWRAPYFWAGWVLWG